MVKELHKGKTEKKEDEERESFKAKQRKVNSLYECMCWQVCCQWRERRPVPFCCAA